MEFDGRHDTTSCLTATLGNSEATAKQPITKLDEEDELKQRSEIYWITKSRR